VFVQEGAKFLTMDVDSKPDPHGRVYVDHWDNNHRVVVIKASSKDVPAHVPLRYSLHSDTCKGKPDED